MAQLDQALGDRLLADIERIKWLLWHGNQYRACNTITCFVDVEALQVDYRNLSKFARAAHEFAVYIAANAA